MTRGRGTRPGRLANVAAQQAANVLQPRATIGEIRNRQRAEVVALNQNGVWLPNPDRPAPIDRHAPQSYEQKVLGLGLAPNYAGAYTDLLYGDAGAGCSVFRRVGIFQVLAPPAGRVAAFPYNKAIGLATMRSSDGRPRYFHISLFSVGNFYQSVPAGTTQPVNEDTVLRFAPGIPTSAFPPGTPLAFGVPLVGTVQFRILVQDESGGRFVDADVIGTRSMNLYGFAVTVFVLIKDDGYEIDTQAAQPGLGPGLVEQTVVGARIIPVMRNDTKNVDNRTVSIVYPEGLGIFNVAIPPGAKRVQIYSIDGVPPASFVLSFRTTTTFGPEGVNANVGNINFNPGQSRTAIYDIPNANVISVGVIGPPPPTNLFSFVFEVTS